VSKAPTARPSVADNIYRLFNTADDDIAETPVSALRQPGIEPTTQAHGTGVDLTGKHKLIMTFGPGRSGKTTMLRWAVERGQRKEGIEPVTLATADAVRPVLKLYFEDVLSPRSADTVNDWLTRLLTRVMASPRTVLLDFGADMSLTPILQHVPTLNRDLVEAGVTPVALYFLSPRITDLSILDSMEHAGFKPEATALIMNIGTIDQAKDPETEFALIRKNSVFKAAVDRGAVQVWMPRHTAAKAAEDRRLPLFLAGAASGEPAPPGLSVIDRSKSWHWLQEMETTFAPVLSWMP
jgi:hypothetical protein